jgi:hypothetical protein
MLQEVFEFQEILRIKMQETENTAECWGNIPAFGELCLPWGKELPSLIYLYNIRYGNLILSDCGYFTGNKMVLR